MGCSTSCQLAAPPPGCVRVVRLTGHAEDLRAPVTAGELTGRPPSAVLVSAAHLADLASARLRPDDRLVPGSVYFLLPHALLCAESSALDLAALMRRLLAASKRVGTAAARPAVPSRKARPRPGAWEPELDAIAETGC
ncbi:uncharacterized protein LOC141821309 [Curcuma longa]|uniref:uncharacterized protein LOC141821309 n=1 Tax=Curcuma longa TaxID=136217 RepID=UPI003D9E4B95